MTGLCRRTAAQTIAGLKLEDANRALAEYWLSLWRGDALPPRAALDPAKLKTFLPNIVMFNVVPDVSVHVRLAGTHFTHMFGGELTGADWIAAAGPARAGIRLAMFSVLARGAVLVDHRHTAMAIGEAELVEEILLPFAAGADGAGLVMAHVNLSPAQYRRLARVKGALGEPLDHQVVPLAAAETMAA